MEVYAHRGVSKDFPENTMLAFQKALDTQAVGIELDVQLSKDGEVVVIHDETVDRTTNGKGYVKDLTLSELKALGICHTNIPVQHIPTLQEVLAWLVTTHLHLNIEFKTDKIRYADIEEKVVWLVKKYQVADRILFSSFSYSSILKCKQLAQEIPANYLVSKRKKKPPIELIKEGINGVNPNVELLQSAGMARLYREANLTLFPYTVNTKAQLELCKAANCTGVIGDDPEQLLKWLQE